MSHTSKKCRKIWQFIGIFMLTCVVSVLPASLAGAQRATKSTVAQMEKEGSNHVWLSFERIPSDEIRHHFPTIYPHHFRLYRRKNKYRLNHRSDFGYNS